MSTLLELAGVSVRMSRRIVLSDASLTIVPGEVVALLGPNGAGKTTLLRAALGLVRATEGSVRLGGDDPAHLPARERARRAAYLPQRPQAIWPISVERLVALGRYAYGSPPDRLSAADKQAVDAALKACGLDALRDRPSDQISGGEKMRAHLARALAQQAPLLVLDEPTASLDPAQALAAAEIVRAHALHGAVLFSTHDISLAARIADRVLVLHEGRTLADGPPAAALTPEVLLRAYGREARLERVGGALVAVFN